MCARARACLRARVTYAHRPHQGEPQLSTPFVHPEDAGKGCLCIRDVEQAEAKAQEAMAALEDMLLRHQVESGG